MSTATAQKPVPACQCDKPGFCPHLKRSMVGRLHHLCQTSEEYRCKWFNNGDCQFAVAKEGCCGKEKPDKVRAKRVGERLVTFASTMAAWASSGFGIASEHERDERRAICRTCPLNEDGWCNGCGCHLKEKVALGVSYCPAGRWFVERERRDVAGPRNLMMHIIPISGNGVWQWNVAELLKRMDLFDGKRVVAILTPNANCKYTLDIVDQVKDAFLEHRIDEWVVRENIPRLREVVTWPLLLESLSKEPGVTFACHAKGVTHGMESITHRWTEAMWRTCLDDWPSVERALTQYSMAGSFKRYGQFKTHGNHRWHYSGTFYWFRNDDVFRTGKDWQSIDQQFFGNESWPGRMFKPHEAACLFMDDSPDLYQSDSWSKRVEREYELWKAARELS